MKITNNTSCKCGCGLIGSILGIVAGIIIAILFSMGLTPLILNGIWITFGIGALALLYIMILASFDGCNGSSCQVLEKCLIRNLKCLLIGTFGTILTTLILTVITLEITSIIVSIIVGLATFFLVFLISSIISLLKCLIYKV